MYVNLTREGNISLFALLRSEKLAQHYAKSSFAVVPLHA
jgi:hypothetical protein